MHAQELVRMGANIKIEAAHHSRKDSAERRRRTCLRLRASASLVLAALVSDGETIIDRVYHIDVGREHRGEAERFGRRDPAHGRNISEEGRSPMARG